MCVANANITAMLARLVSLFWDSYNDCLDITYNAYVYGNLRVGSILNVQSAILALQESVANSGGNVDLTPYLTITDADLTYATTSSLSDYLTTANASSTYATKTSLTSYLTTATASSTYATLFQAYKYLVMV